MLKVSEGVHIGHFLNGKFVRVNRAQKMSKKSGFVRHFLPACFSWEVWTWMISYEIKITSLKPLTLAPSVCRT